MQQFLQFVVNHWILVAIFIALLVVLFYEESRAGIGRKAVSPQNLVTMMNRESILLLDIRDSSAFKQASIINSINIPANQIESSVKRIEKYKQQPVVLVTPTGQNTQPTVNALKKLSFEKIYVLSGGINAWKNADMPLLKKKD